MDGDCENSAMPSIDPLETRGNARHATDPKLRLGDARHPGNEVGMEAASRFYAELCI